jgi:hypothetical protein
MHNYTHDYHFLCYIQQAFPMLHPAGTYISKNKGLFALSIYIPLPPSHPLPSLSDASANAPLLYINLCMDTADTERAGQGGGKGKKCKEWKGGREGRMDEGGRANSM